MKIGTTAPTPTRRQPGPAQPPVGITDLGTASLVVGADTSEEAWRLLTERLPPNGGYLACRLSVTSERVTQAEAAVSKGLHAVGERRRAGQHVPPAWVDRLATLEVELFDALVSWDDAAHQAAICPAWVEIPPGERAIDPGETSWARVSRIVARELQQIAGMNLPDDLYERWVAMEATTTCDEASVEDAREKGRRAIRFCVVNKYGGER